MVVILTSALREYAATAGRGGRMLRVAESGGSPIPQPGLPKLQQRVGTAVSDRVLVVEDDRAVQKALKRLFEAEGYNVQVAPDGNAALELFRSGQPAAVVLDLRL